MAENKKYFFLKLKENFFDTDEMIILESMPDGYLYSNILLKLYLRSLKYDGRLMFNERIPFNSTMLAQVTRHSVGVIEKAMKVFQELGLIEILDNGAIYMLDIQNFIGKSSTEADRVREYRKMIENEKTCTNVQLLYDKSTPELEKEKEKEKEQDPEQEQEKKNDAGASGGGKKTKTAKKEKTAYYPLDELLNQAVLDFIEFRKNIKSPMTDRAVKLLIDRLDKMTTDNNEKIDILNQSIMNGWKGVYPLDRGKQSSGQNRIDEYQRVMQKFAEEEASGKEENMWDSLFK